MNKKLGKVPEKQTEKEILQQGILEDALYGYHQYITSSECKQTVKILKQSIQLSEHQISDKSEVH